MGLDEAIEFWREKADFDAIFITDEKEVYVTEGIADRFTLSSEYAGTLVNIIAK